jgi:DNA recombination protein RmuC
MRPMEIQLIIVLIAINIVITVLPLLRRNKKDSELSQRIDDLDKSLTKIEAAFREDFRINREENSSIAKENRSELNGTLKDFRRELAETLKEITNQSKNDSQLQRDTLINSFKGFQETFDKNVGSFNQLQREKFTLLGEEQKKMVDSTEKRLEEIRITVDEKLQKTLNERLGQSFELVVRQLENVQKGLGEMQTLAQDVGGLKRVLSNVKMRGSIGEVQLAMLLEQILAPGQYEANVKTKSGSAEVVEFAIKLPGRDDQNSTVWLPVDAKFPKDIYEQLQSAHDTGDLLKIDAAQKLLEQTIKKMAKDIHDKYIDPPNTTDFGIMFLPFEGIYAEVVRRASLLDDLQRNFKIVVTGPTTLAAILNSLQMGFKTLAIQQRSGEVWKILGAVKKEFELFGGLVEKAQGNIQTGLNQLDDVLGKRTRAIQRKLKSVEVMEPIDSELILPELSEEELAED